MVVLIIISILMSLSVILALLWAPPAAILGESSRVIFFHVPLAWVSVLAFFVSGVSSVIYLLDRERRFYLVDEKSHNSAALGMLFTLLATITGAIWSKLSWGSYWNWDPRQTSIVVLILIYLAYFSLRTALQGNPNRGKITSVYLIIALFTVPFFVFIVPRVYPSLHPDPIINPDRKIHLEDRMKITLIFAMVSFTFFYFYLFNVLNRVSRITRKLEDRYYEDRDH
jgi:heme exporter protein C